MLDRIEALRQLDALSPKLNVTGERALEKALNKAIAMTLSGVDLEVVKGAGPRTQQNLKRALADCLTMAELKKVSKKWEPKRTVTAGTSHQELVGQLTDLLEERRLPFSPPKLSLAQARSLDPIQTNALSYQIVELCTPAQIKSLLKKWDKRNKSAQTKGVEAQSSHLIALLKLHAEPAAKS